MFERKTIIFPGDFKLIHSFRIIQSTNGLILFEKMSIHESSSKLNVNNNLLTSFKKKIGLIRIIVCWFCQVGFRKPDSETFTDSSSESSDEIDTVETSKLMKKNGGNDVSKGVSILRYGSTCTGREVQNESTTRLKHGVSIKVINRLYIFRWCCVSYFNNCEWSVVLLTLWTRQHFWKSFFLFRVS